MVWDQTIETDDVSSIDDIRDLIAGLDTNGTIQSISIEVTADAPISFAPNIETDAVNESDTASDTPDTTAQPTTKYSTTTASDTASTPTDDGATTIQTSTTATPTTSTDTTDDTADSGTDSTATAIEIRKWPRLSQKLGLDTDLPLSAAAYPADTVDFSGDRDEDVDPNTAYHARVNGTKEYGAFVTLNGTGYSPKSKYQEVTGLIHESNMLEGKGPWSFEQGDSVVVELVSNDEKGLSFRELPLLSSEDAKQARHIEVVRLSKLGIGEGDQITFSQWPEERELAGEVVEINRGAESPPRPPTLTVSVSGTEYTICPSDVVASSTPGQQHASGTTEIGDLLGGTTTETADDTDADAGTDTVTGRLQQTDAAADDTGDDAAQTADPATADDPFTAAPGDESSTDTTTSTAVPDADSDARDTGTDASDDEEHDDADTSDDAGEDADGDDADLECACGRTDFESKQQMWGHQSSCEAYAAAKTGSDDDDAGADDAADEPAAATTDGGAVINPVLLETRYEYFRVAAALHTADDDWFTVTELRDRMAETEWAMDSATIQSHLTSLMDKSAVTRQDTDPYEYALTDRGAAGVDRGLTEGGVDVPEFA